MGLEQSPTHFSLSDSHQVLFRRRRQTEVCRTNCRTNRMRRAVFIDRDGTISEEVGYINHPSRFRLFPYAAAAIKHLNENGWLAILVTNQAGVARGYFSEEMIQTVHAAMTTDLENNGAKLDAIYYCAHHPSVGEPPYRLDCDCRKPKPGLITRAARILISTSAQAGWSEIGTATSNLHEMQV